MRGWLERLNEALRPESRAEADTWADRLRNQVELMGYHQVYARHLVREAPLFTVYSASAKGVTFEQITGEVFNFEAKNLSTHPMLLASPPSLTMASASKALQFWPERPCQEQRNRDLFDCRRSSSHSRCFSERPRFGIHRHSHPRWFSSIWRAMGSSPA